MGSDGFSGGGGARIPNWERKFLSPLPLNWLMTQGPGPRPGLTCNGRGLQHPGSHSSENTCPAPWECQAMTGLAVLVRMRRWGGVRLFLEEMAARLWPSSGAMGQKAAALSWAYSPLMHLRNTGESLSAAGRARPNLYGKRINNSPSHAQGHSIAQHLCWGTSMCMTLTPVPSYSRRDQLPVGEVRELPACLFPHLSQSGSFPSISIHSLFRVTPDSLCFPATFLYLPRAALVVPPEEAGSDKP